MLLFPPGFCFSVKYVLNPLFKIRSLLCSTAHQQSLNPFRAFSFFFVFVNIQQYIFHFVVVQLLSCAWLLATLGAHQQSLTPFHAFSFFFVFVNIQQYIFRFVVFQLLSCAWLLATLGATACWAPLSSTICQSLLKFISIEVVMLCNHLILCCPLLLFPSSFPSIRVFSNESTLHMRWPKYWSFSFSISPSNEHPGLISFRMDWLDLLAVQGTLKSLLQHHSSKASILRQSAFFIVQLSHPFMTSGKTIALTRRTFVGKVMSLLFNMLSRLVITFLPRSKHLLISWLQSPSAVILEPKKIKSDTISTVSPSVSYEVMGTVAMILVFWMLSFKPTFSL